MQCSYHDSGACHSCTLLHLSYGAQLTRAEKYCHHLLPGVAAWLPTAASAPAHFRNKAKLVVGGTSRQPTLGILDGHQRGVDLADCPLYERPLTHAIPLFRQVIIRAGLIPYSVPDRRGELKFVLLTLSPDGELMARFVLRSELQLDALRGQLPWLRQQLPNLAVVTANLHPEHKAVIDGPTELPLTAQESLPMRLNGLTLHLRPQSFFQTNTPVAAALYRQAQDWLADSGDIWDLYCGVGGFALHLAAPGRRTVGVEVSADAVRAAQLSARQSTLPADFVAADAAGWAASQRTRPDAVVVNPPRRGIGELAQWLENSGVRQVVYSSCNPVTLARDLERMPSYSAASGRVFHMFPQTNHLEVAVHLVRA